MKGEKEWESEIGWLREWESKRERESELTEQELDETENVNKSECQKLLLSNMPAAAEASMQSCFRSKKSLSPVSFYLKIFLNLIDEF